MLLRPRPQASPSAGCELRPRPWLQKDYSLSLSESAQVLGTAVRYSIANLAGRSVGVAAKIDKSVLAAFERR